MSGLLERIARRRRATSEQRQDPTPYNGAPTNGAIPPAPAAFADAPAPVADVPQPEPSDVPQPEPSFAAQPEPSFAAPEADPAAPELPPASEAQTTEFIAPSAEPAPEDPQEPEHAQQADQSQEPEDKPHEPPDFVGRGRLRRRARYLRRVREIQLRDIGGFVLELHRFGRERPDLVKAKLQIASDTDTELRAIEQALEEGGSVRELREAGIGGACSQCGAVHGSADRFCSSCGAPLRAAGTDPDTEDPAR